MGFTISMIPSCIHVLTLTKKTIVNYSLWSYGILIYFGKTMVLWKKLWCYTENYETSIYERKKQGRLPKTMNL